MGSRVFAIVMSGILNLNRIFTEKVSENIATKCEVDYPLLVMMGAAAMIGSYLGARLTGRVSLNSLILTMGVVLLVVGALLVVRGIFN